MLQIIAILIASAGLSTGMTFAKFFTDERAAQRMILYAQHFFFIIVFVILGYFFHRDWRIILGIAIFIIVYFLKAQLDQRGIAMIMGISMGIASILPNALFLIGTTTFILGIPVGVRIYSHKKNVQQLIICTALFFAMGTILTILL